MAYTPFTWVDGAAGGTPITATRLNAIESGLAAASLSAVQAVALTGTAQAITLTESPASGETLTLILTQDATGGRTASWPSVVWDGGLEPTLSTSPGARDVITLLYTGTDWLGFLVGSFTGPLTGLALAFTDEASELATQTVYTFASTNLGVASAERVIAVSVYRRTAETLSSVTIGGVTATISTTATTGNGAISIAYASVPTGTSGDVVVTFASSPTFCAIGVAAISGDSVATQVDTGTGTTSTTVTGVTDGVVLAAAGCYSIGGSSLTATWTNATELWDAVTASAGRSHSGAWSAAVGDTTPTVAWTGDPADQVLAAVAFGPGA